MQMASQAGLNRQIDISDRIIEWGLCRMQPSCHDKLAHTQQTFTTGLLQGPILSQHIMPAGSSFVWGQAVTLLLLPPPLLSLTAIAGSLHVPLIATSSHRPPSNSSPSYVKTDLHSHELWQDVDPPLKSRKARNSRMAASCTSVS